MNKKPGGGAAFEPLHHIRHWSSIEKNGEGLSSYKAFTLAEVLITLGIIGIVAAMTIPTLIVSYQKKQTISKLQKSVAVISNLLLKSYSDNGSAGSHLTSGTIVNAENTKNFFDVYWFPYLRFPEVAPNNSPSWYPEERAYKRLDDVVLDTSIYSSYENGRVLFKTPDGIIYFVAVMDWDNIRDASGNIISSIARYDTKQEVIVDVNGVEPPNKFGKDVFYFIADFDKNVILPRCQSSTAQAIDNNCSKTGMGDCCAAKIIKDGWQMKDNYPW